ncbi:MAG: hypothetical protein L0387_43835 [Acidobacteria bacterium]|nr:hypothetical protein [Acidobacteriota bacterium]
MSATSQLLQSVFTKNRAEELGYDVWEHFVVPPLFHRLDLHTARKPRIIIGGRGCGKTMLLRYLSHQTAFSKSRPKIPGDAAAHVGLYWRADTQFANAMSKRDVADDIWQAAFNHMAALILSMEVLGSLKSIAESTCPALEPNDLSNVQLHRLQAFDGDLPGSIDEFRQTLEEKLWAFESWVNDVRKVPEPRFLPGPKFVLALIRQIQEQIPTLRQTIYFVYFDEYENLCVYQQEMINTWLKHSEIPLIFSLAMKRNAFETRRTVGPESLSDIHDFRQHDLEEYLSNEEDFPLFAAEILFLHLSLAGLAGTPVNPRDLRDPTKMAERRNSMYRRRVLDAAEKILPDLSQEELAHGVFGDSALAQKLRSRIQTALKHRGSRIDVGRFFRPDLPQASIVTPALLYRGNIQPSKIADELDSLAAGQPNRFSGPTNWIHNNFVGCLLQLYEPHFRACPFYAGFHTFCYLARGNIRHFLELCYKSIYRGLTEGHAVGTSVPPTQQAEAARQASTDFLGEVRSFGPRGNQLHTFVLRLGSLFALAHQRPTQSESEQSHFSIGPGSKELLSEDEHFLREATKWSVLFEHRGTKKKEGHLPESLEYILNPIYAPYFHISYRKKRRLELRSEEIICLIRGTYEEVTALLRRFSRTWTVEPGDAAPSLFSHLTQQQQ